MRQHALELSGLELLQRAIAGELPPAPMANLLDIHLTEVSRGRAVFTGTPQEFHYNLLGSVHGGYGATLLDSAMGCAVNSTLTAGDLYTTLEFKINFLRALTQQAGPLQAIGTVINETRTTALAEGRLQDAAGTLYAFATTTCLIRRATP